MRKKHYQWAVPLTGAVLFTTAVSAEQDKYTYLDSTNRVTLSLRFGLNISGKFKGVGSSFLSGSSGANARRTPNGDLYNYDDGYVLTDSTGNFLGLTTYWGYDSTAAQYDPVADTIAFHNSTATGIPSEASGDNNDPYPGFELTYDRELGNKENWHGLRYGIEGAVNYMKIVFNDTSSFGATVTTLTTIYQLPGTTPPPATPSSPFQGTFDGSPGGYSLIDVPPIGTLPASVSSGTFFSQDHFNADLWGFRLGPYVELPLTENFSLHLSGGLAVGLLYGNAAWQESLALSGGGSLNASGGGDAFDTLWGYYASLDASYQINKRWGVEGGVQFQDLGNYSHSFGGREVALDLSRSLFVQVGVSYSF